MCSGGSGAASTNAPARPACAPGRPAPCRRPARGRSRARRRSAGRPGSNDRARSRRSLRLGRAELTEPRRPIRCPAVRRGSAGRAAAPRRGGRPLPARARPAAGRRASALAGDPRQHGPDRDCLLDRHQDLGDDAGDRRRHLGVDLVGRDLADRLVGRDPVANLHPPRDHGALGDRHPHLGHRHVNQ